jgi:hypothetical protein
MKNGSLFCRIKNSEVRQNLVLFPWEQREFIEHIEIMHNERQQKEFLLAGVLRIAKAVNAHDPITSGELIDLIEDCVKQINSKPK